MDGGEYQWRLKAIGADQGRMALSCDKAETRRSRYAAVNSPSDPEPVFSEIGR